MKRSTIVVAASMLVAGVVASRDGIQGVRAQSVQIDRASIGGAVLNSKGQIPEAGVWVVAETSSLPTHFRKIVVTDDQGRFVVPDLPEASYEVWVRGYGLSDSARVTASRGERVTLQVDDAATPQQAAQIYPSNYWLSLLQAPPQEELPSQFESQDHWIAQMKLGCMLCHQMGAQPTRTKTTPESWDAALRLTDNMPRTAEALGKESLTKVLVDWSKRIAAGEVPPVPPRPTGVERNFVVTQWQWGRTDSYIHDEIATDKRKPTLYPYGKVYGVDIGMDFLWALDPLKHTVTSHKVPTRNGYNGRWDFGSRRVYTQVANPHNPMMDDKGNVWITTQIRGEKPEDRPKWAQSVISNVEATESSARDKAAGEFEGNHHRQLGYFDTKTQKFVLIDTAYGTHHLQFDRQGRIWTSLDGTSLGMFDPREFDPDYPVETEWRAQKAFVKIDPKTGKSVSGGGYGIIVSPVDGTVWRAQPSSGGAQNKLNKFDPKNRTFKDYPLPPPGRGPRGIDATTDGRLWFGTGSGHLGRFDPKTEKFTYWESPGPKLKGTGKETGAADFHYYIWVDQFDTLGMGKDMVILNGTNSDSLLVFDPAKESWTIIRVPYPVDMFTRGLDGRIDDAKAGWKGRGLWANYGNDPITWVENTGTGYVNHIQLRPNPLAY